MNIAIYVLAIQFNNTVFELKAKGDKVNSTT